MKFGLKRPFLPVCGSKGMAVMQMSLPGYKCIFESTRAYARSIGYVSHGDYPTVRSGVPRNLLPPRLRKRGKQLGFQTELFMD